MERSDLTEGALHVAVTDTGIGIPADKQALIFEAFSQADGSITRRYGGTGLGLTISSNLVRLMGGRIWVESTAERGSTFHFTVEAAILPDETPNLMPLIKLRDLSVLVVDDNATNRRIFEKTLEKWQMRTTLVDNGADALRAVRDAEERGDPFHLVLLDANMPGMDGFTVASELTKGTSTSAPTIMMLTSSGEPHDSVRCRLLGISSYLVKPVRQAALCEAILETLGRASAKRKQLARPASQPRSASLNILLAEDNVVNQRVAIGILEKAGHVVTLAENGRIALEKLDTDTFDLVLMDMQMPEMGGAEAILEIRRREHLTGRHQPIVSLTAHALKGDRERCLETGADGYVSKPIAPAALFGEMDMAMTSGSAHVPASTTTVKSSSVTDTLLARVGGSHEVLQEIIGLFLEDCPNLLEAIRTALAAADAQAVYRAAHTLKGSVGNFEAHSAVEIAQRLEARAREGDIAAATAVFAALEIEIQAVMKSLSGTEQTLQCAS
jgi:two-component system, sensor histidine kinase and response regulator